MLPQIQYADSGGIQIAYQVVGDGPLDVVLSFDWGSNLDLIWEWPQNERLFRRFTNYGRLILFDMRGVGLSDPIQNLPPMEEWMEDVTAVMDAVGSSRAALVGHGHAGQLCMLFAATHPERSVSLVTINSYARLARAHDYPWGLPAEAQAAVIELISQVWGSGEAMGSLYPNLTSDPRMHESLARMERAVASPGRVVLRQRLLFELDVRGVLPAISVPTLVAQSEDHPTIRTGHGRYLADHIAGARYLAVPSDSHAPWADAGADVLLDGIEEFLTGTRTTETADRMLTTVAFTDIVRSTERASELGDRRWRELLELHESVSRREIEAARGRLVKSTGDGLLATFDGPARAIRCVTALGELLRPLGLEIRAGLHTGEVELLGEDVGGIAVHIAARVGGLASPGEVLVSSTVKDLVAGSGIAFEDRGLHELKGIAEEWRLFAAT
ncbi:MAG: adenylate/guanylate cyclase domain-containing protein [Actinomycetota bacterium]